MCFTRTISARSWTGSGHVGGEIVHPQFKVVEPGVPLPDRLTPVYPTTAGLGQETLRKLIARALAAEPELIAELLPSALTARLPYFWIAVCRGWTGSSSRGRSAP